MIAFALTDSVLAIGHHLYYAFLNAFITGSPSKYQWAIRVGTVLAYAIASLFTAAIGVSTLDIVQTKSFLA
ncbi:hypothetical protein EYC84_008823 [Monilinia fructicola]|uniref:Uncharacterized protein n=1 Tax=Monilinia fructicola TaxID=38448 RepID=A0A5M9JCY1_MONFR|nr:hypothetical protein EYC84_008823 [Monilinia fructicola]